MQPGPTSQPASGRRAQNGDPHRRAPPEGRPMRQRSGVVRQPPDSKFPSSWIGRFSPGLFGALIGGDVQVRRSIAASGCSASGTGRTAARRRRHHTLTWPAPIRQFRRPGRPRSEHPRCRHAPRHSTGCPTVRASSSSSPGTPIAPRPLWANLPTAPIGGFKLWPATRPPKSWRNWRPTTTKTYVWL